MTLTEILKPVFQQFAGMPAEDFDLSQGCWREKAFNKGELFNDYKNVCKELGFIVEGTFRSYIIDPKSGEERNIFFYSQNGFISAYKSFVNQIPCEYYTEALTDAQIVCINLADLQTLYKKSHEWECFGRIIAERAASYCYRAGRKFFAQVPRRALPGFNRGTSRPLRESSHSTISPPIWEFKVLLSVGSEKDWRANSDFNLG